MNRYLGSNPKKAKNFRDTPASKAKGYMKEEKNTRKREFQASWVKSYPWILYDQGNNAMFCTWVVIIVSGS